VNAQKNANLKKGVSGSLLKKLVVPVPPLPEQWKIAGVLELVQRALEQQERLMALTTELKKALLHQLFTQGLRGEPQKQTDIGPIPQSWEAATLGELTCKPGGSLQTGPFGSQLHKHDYLSEGVGVVNPTHLWDNQINHEDVPRVSPETAARLERHRLEVGDILFARRGEIGRHGMVTEKEDGWLCGTGCFLARVRRMDIDNRFLSYLFSTSGCIAWLNSHAAGAIMPNLNNTVLRTMPVFFPKLEIQTKIANCLDATEQKMAIHQRKFASLAALFRTLLHQLMTAQIRVNHIDYSEVSRRAQTSAGPL
jgi:type I restriction enzyme S subunit